MSILRVGIIGLGEIAQSHCSAIAELDSVEVVAVADFFEEKQRQYMDQYNIAKGYNTHTEFLGRSGGGCCRYYPWPSTASSFDCGCV